MRGFHVASFVLSSIVHRLNVSNVRGSLFLRFNWTCTSRFKVLFFKFNITKNLKLSFTRCLSFRGMMIFHVQVLRLLGGLPACFGE